MTKCSVEGCTRNAFTRGFCGSHYTMFWRSQNEGKVCPCGKKTAAGQTHCSTCFTRLYRLREREQRLSREKEYELVGKKGEWPEPENLWIQLQLCGRNDLKTFLSSRSGKRFGIWPQTDHSLSCWIEAQIDSTAPCRCGAAALSTR